MLFNEITERDIDRVIRANNAATGNNQQMKSQKNRNAARDALFWADNYSELEAYIWGAQCRDVVETCRDFIRSKRTAAAVTTNTPAASASDPDTCLPGDEPLGKSPVIIDTTFKASPSVAGSQAPSVPSEGLDMLASVVAKLLSSMKMGDITASVTEDLKAEVDKYIKDTYGPITRQVTIDLNGNKSVIKGVMHEKFDEVLSFVASNEPVYLAGPAGTGKNFLCKQIADCLGLDFYFSNAITQEYKLTGFTDANGRYQPSQFYEAFRPDGHGGLFMLDELDASIPEVLIILNAAIANRYFDFPAPIGRVEAHPDFRIIAAGNTFGLGADLEYVGRSQLDAASLDRFAVVEVNYDPRIEEAMASGDSDLLGFCRAFRRATKESGIKVVVSYRAISRMSKLSKLMDTKELLKTCLIKSLDKQDLMTIKDRLSGFGRYSAAFAQLV